MESTNVSGLVGFGHDDFDVLSPVTADGPSLKRANALSTKLAAVLSSSYADSELREALRLLDIKDTQATSSHQTDLKANVQKEVIDANGRIIDDFGNVAEVRSCLLSILPFF